MRPGGDALRRDLAAGREPAYAVLYDQFGVRMYRAAQGMLGCPEDAEDVVQEVFLTLVRGRARLAVVEDMSAYLFTALRRAAARRAARRDRFPVASTAAAEGAVAGADPPQSTHPRSDRLERALRALPPEQREVITLKIDGDLTFAEIARVLEISPNTAASRYRYALEKLRAALEDS